jgi:hypothetical protein
MRPAKLILLCLLPAAQAAPQITSEQLGANHYRLGVTGKFATIETAQAALAPTARRLCGTAGHNFGTFRFSQAPEPASAVRKIEQELFCGIAQARINTAAPPPGWQPGEADQRAVLAATYAYFSAKDLGRYHEAWSRLSISMKKSALADGWQKEATAFNRRAGPVRSRRVTEITWYNNPPDGPQPGLYVAADFSAEFDKLEFLCGYVMWRLEPGGALGVTREEQNLLEKGTAKHLASIDRAPLRAQMGCKD